MVNRGGGYPYDATTAQVAAAAARAGVQRYQLRLVEGMAAAEKAVAGADVVVGWDLPLAVLRALARPPRLIHLTGVGLDRFQPIDWLPRGTLLTNSAGAHAGKAYEVATLVLLMAQMQLPALAQAQRESRWDQRLTARAAGTRVLIAGLGTIGGTAARAAKALGMRVTGLRRTPAAHPDTHRLISRQELPAALAETDILLAALPATAETNALFDGDMLSSLPATATVISLGRAACLDLDALATALDQGRLAGAILDGFPQEPLSPTSRLWTTRKLVVLPHVTGGDATAFTDASLDILFDNFGRLSRAEMLRNVVEPGLGY